MISAKTRHPDMKRGTYYSMPEWYDEAIQGRNFVNSLFRLGSTRLLRNTVSETGLEERPEMRIIHQRWSHTLDILKERIILKIFNTDSELYPELHGLLRTCMISESESCVQLWKFVVGNHGYDTSMRRIAEERFMNALTTANMQGK